MMRRLAMNFAKIAIIIPIAIPATFAAVCIVLGEHMEKAGPSWRWVAALARVYDRVDRWGNRK